MDDEREGERDGFERLRVRVTGALARVPRLRAPRLREVARHVVPKLLAPDLPLDRGDAIETWRAMGMGPAVSHGKVTARGASRGRSGSTATMSQ